MRNFKLAQTIALGATVLSIAGIIINEGLGINFGEILMMVGFLAGIVSYIFGGFGTALKMAGKIAKWGWFVVPFPYDIMTFILSFIFTVVAFVFVPIIPVRKAYKEALKEGLVYEA